MRERLSRIIRLIDDDSFYPWISRCRVLLVGVGGVGATVAELLVRSGVRFLTLVDGDSIEESNLNRAFCALPEDVGRKKVDVVRARLNALLAMDEPHEAYEIKATCLHLNALDIKTLDLSVYDAVVDCIDDVDAKSALLEKAAARGEKREVISMLGAGNKLDGLCFKVGKLSEAEICPLATKIRDRLCDKDIGTIRCVYSTAKPIDLGRNENGKRILGVAGHVAVAAAAAVVQAFLDIFSDTKQYILGIESTCDDSCVAVMSVDKNKVAPPKLLFHKKISSWNEHQALPDIDKTLAAARHLQNLPELVQEATRLAPRIDAVGVSTHPGFIKCLEVGYREARKLEARCNARLMPINHLESHLLMNFFGKSLEFPWLAMVVSGGNAQVIYAQSLGHYYVLEKTHDVGPGAVLDQLARILLPAGGEISASALDLFSRTAPSPSATERGTLSHLAALLAFDEAPLAFLPALRGAKDVKNHVRPAVLARFFQENLTSGLLNKLTSIIDHQLHNFDVGHILLGGGCSANSWLRSGFEAWCMRQNYKLSIPASLEYCVDNAVMIAHTAFLYMQEEARRIVAGTMPFTYAGQGVLLEHEATVGKDCSKNSIPSALKHDRDQRDTILAPEHIDRAAHAIRAGQLVIFPTETVYGIGASAYDDHAVESIFSAKGRPNDNPLIVHVASIEMLESLAAEITEHHKMLIKAFWPGPLSMIFKSKARGISTRVSCGLETLAIRMPDNPIALELISAANVPIAAPSANLSGYPSATCPEHALHDFEGKVTYILDGGTSRYGFESTIVQVNAASVTILRQGPIGADDIAQVTGLPIDIGRLQLSPDAKPSAPGMKYRHYSPDKPVYLVAGDPSYLAGLTASLKAENKKVGLVLDETIPAPAAASKIFYYQRLGESLYAGLRRLDKDDIDVILVTAPSSGSLYWEAIMEKLHKIAVKEFCQT